MITLESSIVINKPVEQVFAYLSDGRNEAQWSTGVIEVRQTPEGPMHAGTQLTEVRNFMGHKIESLSEIVEYVHNKRFVRKGSSEKFSVEGMFSFEPVARGTQVTWRMQMQPGGFFKLAEPLVAATVKKDIDSNLKTVKSLLEK